MHDTCISKHSISLIWKSIFCLIRHCQQAGFYFLVPHREILVGQSPDDNLFLHNQFYLIMYQKEMQIKSAFQEYLMGHQVMKCSALTQGWTSQLVKIIYFCVLLIADYGDNINTAGKVKRNEKLHIKYYNLLSLS